MRGMRRGLMPHACCGARACMQRHAAMPAALAWVQQLQLVAAGAEGVVKLVQAPDALERQRGGVQAHQRGHRAADGHRKLVQLAGVCVVLVDGKHVQPHARAVLGAGQRL